jgi:hypothetical protein
VLQQTATITHKCTRTEGKLSRTQEVVGGLSHGRTHDGTWSISHGDLILDESRHVIDPRGVRQRTSSELEDAIDRLADVVGILVNLGETLAVILDLVRQKQRRLPSGGGYDDAVGWCGRKRRRKQKCRRCGGDEGRQQEARELHLGDTKRE